MVLWVYHFIVNKALCHFLYWLPTLECNFDGFWQTCQNFSTVSSWSLMRKFRSMSFAANSFFHTEGSLPFTLFVLSLMSFLPPIPSMAQRKSFWISWLCTVVTSICRSNKSRLRVHFLKLPFVLFVLPFWVGKKMFIYSSSLTWEKLWFSDLTVWILSVVTWSVALVPMGNIPSVL